MSAADVNFFFSLRDQIKLYHWQTKSYSRHKATDGVIEELDKLIDEYVETYMGTYGRPKLTGKMATITVRNLSEASIVKCIQAATVYLKGPLVKGLKPQDTDLVNLRDEMLGALHQLLYLFTLH